MITNIDLKEIEKLSAMTNTICECTCGCSKNLTNGMHRCLNCSFNDCGERY